MALQITTNINVDFYDNKYVMVNAKQYDDRSRLVSITCYNDGELYNLSAKNHTAYIKYRKADERWVLNSCTINYKGQVLVELTEQMLAASGICYVDLFVVNKGSAKVNIDTGSIVTIDGSSVLTTKAFYVDVQEAVIDNSLIESVDDYDGLTGLLNRAEAEYSEVIQLAKSYAVGTNNVVRDNDEQDNAKYYYEQSLINADNAKLSETNAATSEANAKTSENNAKTSETNAKTSETKSAISEANAKLSETNAAISEANAKLSETNAATSEANAHISEQNAKTSEINATTSEENAKLSETNAAASEILAKSYAIGGTGTRENEDMNNAQYYCEVIKSVVDGLNSGFIPIGTITFAELATAEKATGFTYNISDDFTTDETFVEGSGKPYVAGTNVYYTASGKWDCFGGSASPTATVDEVRSYLGI